MFSSFPGVCVIWSTDEDPHEDTRDGVDCSHQVAFTKNLHCFLLLEMKAPSRLLFRPMRKQLILHGQYIFWMFWVDQKISTRLGNFWAENDQSPPSEKVGKDSSISQFNAENLNWYLSICAGHLEWPWNNGFHWRALKTLLGHCHIRSGILINWDRLGFTNPAFDKEMSIIW